MRVERVDLTPVLVADPPLLNADGVHQPYTPRLIVEIVTEGATGIAEAPGGTAILSAATQLAGRCRGASLLERLPIAREPSDDHAGAPVSRTPSRTPAGAWARAAAAFEAAALDALARAWQVPLHALLGGAARTKVPVTGYLFFKWAAHPGGPADRWGQALCAPEVVAEAQQMADRFGFRSFKLKGGVFPPDVEIGTVEALRAAFPTAALTIDPNGAWSVDTAVRVIDRLGDLVRYLEDPVSGVEAMGEVRRRTGFPLATNMCVTSFADLPGALRADAVQVVLTDHHYWGLRGAVSMSQVAAGGAVGVSLHSNTHLGVSLATMAHVAAAMPELTHPIDTHAPWLGEDVVTDPIRIEDGWLTVPDAPGLGVDIDRDALTALHERWKGSTIRDRDDVAAMAVAAPGYRRPTMPKW